MAKGTIQTVLIEMMVILQVVMVEVRVGQWKQDRLDHEKVLHLKIHALRYAEMADDLIQIQLMVMGEVLYAKKSQDWLALEDIYQIKIHAMIYVEME